MKCVNSFFESQSKATPSSSSSGAISRSDVASRGTISRTSSSSSSLGRSSASFATKITREKAPVEVQKEVVGPPPFVVSTPLQRTATRSQVTSTRDDFVTSDEEEYEKSKTETISRPPKVSTSRITVNSVTNLNEFEELDLFATYPAVKVYRRRVEASGGTWMPAFWNFDMLVFYMPFRDDAPCRPAIIYLHPAQVFSVRHTQIEVIYLYGHHGHHRVKMVYIGYHIDC